MVLITSDKYGNNKARRYSLRNELCSALAITIPCHIVFGGPAFSTWPAGYMGHGCWKVPSISRHCLLSFVFFPLNFSLSHISFDFISSTKRLTIDLWIYGLHMPGYIWYFTSIQLHVASVENVYLGFFCTIILLYYLALNK